MLHYIKLRESFHWSTTTYSLTSLINCRESLHTSSSTNLSPAPSYSQNTAPAYISSVGDVADISKDLPFFPHNPPAICSPPSTNTLLLGNPTTTTTTTSLSSAYSPWQAISAFSNCLWAFQHLWLALQSCSIDKYCCCLTVFADIFLPGMTNWAAYGYLGNNNNDNDEHDKTDI